MQHRAALASSNAPAIDEPGLAAPPTPPAVPSPPLEVSPSPEPVVNAAPAPTETAAPSPPSKRADNGVRPKDSLNDSLEAESAMLPEARAELRGGDARASMATLDRLRAQFPKGILAQEREVLGIEVLAALGDAEGASRRARAFSDAHPDSPHTAKLRRFIIDP